MSPKNRIQFIDAIEELLDDVRRVKAENEARVRELEKLEKQVRDALVASPKTKRTLTLSAGMAWLETKSGQLHCYVRIGETSFLVESTPLKAIIAARKSLGVEK